MMGPTYAGEYFGDLPITHELVGQATIGWSAQAVRGPQQGFMTVVYDMLEVGLD